MIWRLPSSTAWHQCSDPERCDYLHAIDLYSVRSVIESGLRRAGIPSWTTGGLMVHTLHFRDKDHDVTITFGAIPLPGNTAWMRADWDRIDHIDVLPLGVAKQRDREEAEDHADEIAHDRYWDQKLMRELGK